MRQSADLLPAPKFTSRLAALPKHRLVALPVNAWPKAKRAKPVKRKRARR